MLSRLKFQIEPLVNEILDQLPAEVWTSKTSTFLDPALAGGQFVREIERRLRAVGHSAKNISGRVYGCESSILAVKYAVNKYKLAGTYGVGDFLNKDFGSMKFDVVVGNPPYQDHSGRNTIYPKFYAKSNTLLKKNGILTMITPPAIICGLWGLKNPDGITMPEPIKIERIVLGKNLKSHFPNIGQEFCYFILRNESKVDNSKVKITIDGVGVEVTSPIIPKIFESRNDIPLIQSILNKCFIFNCDPYKTTSSDYGKNAKTSKNGKHLAVETLSNGDFVTRKITWTGSHRHLGVPKVMISMYGNCALVDYTHNLVSAACEKTENGKLKGHNVLTVVTNNDAESEMLVKVLASKLQKFFNHVTWETRAPYVHFLKNFKGVDLSKKWTDNKLYAHFGLTQEEINYIETTVK
jgi:site-specific DNA-methyltransferase (adenine-specific)